MRVSMTSRRRITAWRPNSTQIYTRMIRMPMHVCAASIRHIQSSATPNSAPGTTAGESGGPPHGTRPPPPHRGHGLRLRSIISSMPMNRWRSTNRNVVKTCGIHSTSLPLRGDAVAKRTSLCRACGGARTVPGVVWRGGNHLTAVRSVAEPGKSHARAGY